MEWAQIQKKGRAGNVTKSFYEKGAPSPVGMRRGLSRRPTPPPRPTRAPLVRRSGRGLSRRRRAPLAPRRPHVTAGRVRIAPTPCASHAPSCRPLVARSRLAVVPALGRLRRRGSARRRGAVLTLPLVSGGGSPRPQLPRAGRGGCCVPRS